MGGEEEEGGKGDGWEEEEVIYCRHRWRARFPGCWRRGRVMRLLAWLLHTIMIPETGSPETLLPSLWIYDSKEK